MKNLALIVLMAGALAACSVGPRTSAANASRDIQARAQMVLDRYGYDIDVRSLTEGQAVRISRINTGLPRARATSQIDAALAL